MMVAHRSLPVVATPERSAPRAARISLTDRCDLACVYCRPERRNGPSHESALAEQAWRTMVVGLVHSGIRRIRLTGGEPLLHPHVVERVRWLASLGLDDLALTTNGTRLARLAVPLRRAGLRRVTVSLDTLDPGRFARITRGGRLEQVLAGIDAASQARFPEIKTNTVVLRGDNDAELPALTTWAWDRSIVPRFLEVMAVGPAADLARRVLVSVGEMRDRIAHLVAAGPLAHEPDRGPARYARSSRDPSLRVGFISGMTESFCDGCDRLRLTPDGRLHPCLALPDGVSASAAAAAGDSRAVADAAARAWSLKPDGRSWRGCAEPVAEKTRMWCIGG